MRTCYVPGMGPSILHILTSFVASKSPTRWVFLSQFTGGGGDWSSDYVCTSTEMRKWKPWDVSQVIQNPNARMTSLGISADAWTQPITQKLWSLRCKTSFTLHAQTILYFLSPDTVSNGSPQNQTFHSVWPPGFTIHGKITLSLSLSRGFSPPSGHCFRGNSYSLHSFISQVPHSWDEPWNLSHTVLLLPNHCSGIKPHSFAPLSIRPYQPLSLFFTPHWLPTHSPVVLENFASQSSSP